jgi:hypothetical protein
MELLNGGVGGVGLGAIDMTNSMHQGYSPANIYSIVEQAEAAKNPYGIGGYIDTSDVKNANHLKYGAAAFGSEGNLSGVYKVSLDDNGKKSSKANELYLKYSPLIAPGVLLDAHSVSASDSNGNSRDERQFGAQYSNDHNHAGFNYIQSQDNGFNRATTEGNISVDLGVGLGRIGAGYAKTHGKEHNYQDELRRLSINYSPEIIPGASIYGSYENRSDNFGYDGNRTNVGANYANHNFNVDINASRSRDNTGIPNNTNIGFNLGYRW